MVYGPGADMARYLARVEADKITPAAAEAAGARLAARMRGEERCPPDATCAQCNPRPKG